jgi:hypothetical protein
MTNQFLPFYTEIARQRHRQYGQHKFAFGLKCPLSFPLPFQLSGQGEVTVVPNLYIISASDNQTEFELSGVNLEINNYEPTAQWWVTYNGALNDILQCGFWYYRIEILGVTYYSEVLELVALDVLENYAMIESWNMTNKYGLLFQTGFRQRVYLAFVINRPEIENEKEQVTNSLGSTVVTFSKITLKKSVSFMEIPDYLMYALVTAASLSNNELTFGAYTDIAKDCVWAFEQYGTELNTGILTYSNDTSSASGCEKNLEI